jgi:multicomponent Na+:H+ antiporter subunit E
MSSAPQVPSSTVGRRPPPLTVLLVKGGSLLLFWAVLSGKFDAFHLSVGLLSVLFVLWMDFRLAPLGDADVSRVHPVRFVIYYFWLLKEMVLSAVFVARAIISPSLYVDPRLVCFRSEQPGVVSAVVLANSITLTPGTLTVDLEDNVYLVHALNSRTANDLLSGSMQARVAALFGANPPPPVEIEIEEARLGRNTS